MSPEKQHNYPARPFRPEETLAVRAESMPDEVFVAVNSLIAEKLRGQYATFAIKTLKQRMTELGLKAEDIETHAWWKIGGIYRQAGWDVSVEYPGLDDRDFDPYYRFRTKGPRDF